MIQSKKLLFNNTVTLTVVTTPSNATCQLYYDGAWHTTNTCTVPSGTTVSYQVSASGYTTQSGSWTITSDETKYVTLSAVQYSFTINLQDQYGSAISGTIYYRLGSSGSYTSVSGSSYTINNITNGTTVYYYVYQSTYGTSSTYSTTITSNTTKTFKGQYTSTTSDVYWSSPSNATGYVTGGGSSFGCVSASSVAYGSNYYAYGWRAFDGKESTRTSVYPNSWASASQSANIVVYNPTAIKLSSFTCRNIIGDGATYRTPESGSVDASNDGSNWTTIKSSFTNSTVSNGSTWSVSVNSGSYYKYFRFNFSKSTGTSTYKMFVNEMWLYGYYKYSSYSYSWATPT